MTRLTVTRLEQLPQGQFWYRVRKVGGGFSHFPARRSYIAWLMAINPDDHPAQHLGKLTLEEFSPGVWVWVEPGEAK